MSGLAGLLRGDRAPGVFTWHSALDPDDVGRAVEQAGFAFGYVDGWANQTKEDFLRAVGEALGFPDYYGANLDAFADCLDDLAGKSVVLLWDGWSTLARSEPEALSAVIEIAVDRADQLTSPFTLLLRGAGPRIDLPALDG